MSCCRIFMYTNKAHRGWPRLTSRRFVVLFLKESQKCILSTQIDFPNGITVFLGPWGPIFPSEILAWWTNVLVTGHILVPGDQQIHIVRQEWVVVVLGHKYCGNEGNHLSVVPLGNLRSATTWFFVYHNMLTDVQMFSVVYKFALHTPYLIQYWVPGKFGRNQDSSTRLCTKKLANCSLAVIEKYGSLMYTLNRDNHLSSTSLD